ncbi:16S rRNA-processing protein RimM [Salinisphaera dokdonensis CL-ES53]|uniref:Ribosome maturation factor RimM n=1 Tax=Salinisphaera dokdonensis CL-ES53 TaxID=1304272 RepID=A0ABV2AW79_9GAMM
MSGLFGVKGWIKVYSYTRPAANLIEYEDWLIGRQDAWRPFRVIDAREQGKTLIAQIAPGDESPLADRDAAAALIDFEIAVERDQLPEPEPGEYYWFDLVGLDVVNRDGTELGRVKAMMETGANDVLVLQGDRERLVPFVVGEIIDEVDLKAGRIVADWDPEF